MVVAQVGFGHNLKKKKKKLLVLKRKLVFAHSSLLWQQTAVRSRPHHEDAKCTDKVA